MGKKHDYSNEHMNEKSIMNMVVRISTINCCWGLCRKAVLSVKSKAPIGQGRANMALGVVLGQLASMPGLPQKERADYHDEAMLALQQAVACDPADINILYNLALVQVSFCINRHKSLCFGSLVLVAMWDAILV